VTSRDPVAEVIELVDRETRAWDERDVELLLSVFHRDMVWPWPPDTRTHDPMGWVLVWGRYDRERWGRGWQELFDTHELVHNRRRTRRVEVSAEEDGAFAVVDIDTLWRDADGHDFHWKGRTCKVYTRLRDGPEAGEWKMIAQWGVLEY